MESSSGIIATAQVRQKQYDKEYLRPSSEQRWYVREDLYPEPCKEWHPFFTEKMIEIGNYFNTREEAKQKANVLRRMFKAPLI